MPSLQGVLLDILHFIKRLSESTAGVSHPMHAAFVRDVRDAIFVVLEEDRSKVVDELVESGRIQRDAVQYIPQSYFVETCRRTVRPAAELLEKLDAVFAHYKDMMCVIPGNPAKELPDRQVALISDRHIRLWEKQKVHIRRACVRDPPGVSMYIPIKDRKDPSKVGLCVWESNHHPSLVCGLKSILGVGPRRWPATSPSAGHLTWRATTWSIKTSSPGGTLPSSACTP